MQPQAAPTCNITFSTTAAADPQAAVGSSLGSLYYTGTSGGASCPVDSCATAGWYYITDSSGGIALVSRSTVVSDACPIILGTVGAGANDQAGTYVGYYFASSQYPPPYIYTTNSGLAGAWWSGVCNHHASH